MFVFDFHAKNRVRKLFSFELSEFWLSKYGGLGLVDVYVNYRILNTNFCPIILKPKTVVKF